jgi:hypothetical protein
VRLSLYSVNYTVVVKVLTKARRHISIFKNRPLKIPGFVGFSKFSHKKYTRHSSALCSVFWRTSNVWFIYSDKICMKNANVCALAVCGSITQTQIRVRRSFSVEAKRCEN